VPTVGFTVETVMLERIHFTVWDVGGQVSRKKGDFPFHSDSSWNLLLLFDLLKDYSLFFCRIKFVHYGVIIIQELKALYLLLILLIMNDLMKHVGN
jgi:hypothetical protein